MRRKRGVDIEGWGPRLGYTAARAARSQELEVATGTCRMAVARSRC